MSEPVQAAGLYIHVPFCERKCPYCSFFSIAGAGNRELQQRYVHAALSQMDRLAVGAGEAGISVPRTVDTIFFGGGTPTVLPVHFLADLLATSLELFDTSLGESLEVSIEVNPGTVDRDDLLSLRRAGFNRISIGVQSLDDGELLRLGRIHDRTQAEQTVTWARQAGFSNLSLDLMFGLPGQDLASWKKTLDRALDLSPDHLSIYELTLEEETSFARLAGEGALCLPDEEMVCAMMEYTIDRTEAAGLHRYEISNYARPGFACRHNLKYWDNTVYIGIGPAAVSYLDQTRLTAVADVEAYCHFLLASDAGQNWQRLWVEREVLDLEARFRETVVMGLRLVQGVSRTRLRQRFGLDPVPWYGPVLDRLRDAGLVELAGEYLRLTPRGLRLANTVMAELV
ncbi:radical SAM family heme chaperone HemW [Desulfolithobacter sp.]